MTQRYIGGLIYNPPGGWSGYFDGSGDYLQAGTSSNLALGSGDFTVEGWHFCTGYNGGGALYSTINTYPSSTGFLFYIYSDGSYTIDVNGTILKTTAVAALNTWVHYAVVRSGSTITIYANGTSVGTVSNSTNFTDQYAVIGRTGAGSASNYYLGYLSNCRTVKGTAVYTTAFTPPNGPLQNITNTSLLTCRYPTFVDGSNNAFTITVNGNTTVSTQNPFPLTTLPNPAQGNAGNGIFSMSQYQSLKQQNLWPVSDPYFDYTTLLLHGNGTNGGQNNTFQDSSSNNFTITRNGNTTQGTFSPFSQTGWSNYFDGSGDYLTLGGQSAFVFGTGDFTIEMFAYVTNTANTIFDLRPSTPSGAYITIYMTGGVIYYYANGANQINGGTLPLNQWVHIVASRVSSNTRLFINGVQVGSTYSDTTNYTTSGSRPIIGADGNVTGSTPMIGYLSNLRVVKGSGVTSVTVPTAPLTNITNTSLLTCQSNRFVDNSSNAFTITVTGDTSVQAFSPFQPTSAWSASTNGGSGYFDGSGDSLSVAANAAWNLGSSAFTIECWSYPTASQSDKHLFSLNSSGGTGYWVLRYDTGTVPQFIYNNYGTSLTSSTAATLNQWNHIAMVSNGSTMSLYLNGTRVATASASSINDGSSNPLYVGSQYGVNRDISGYLASGRVVKGSAVYDPSQSTLTVPTAPLTAITNTQLLLNFTNAGIIDSTAKNDLQTVGNAQISTAQSKFGGASMYFDGTGDYLQNRLTDLTNFGTGDFTMECWIYPTASGSLRTIVDTRGTDINAAYGWFLSASDKLDFLYKGSSPFRLTSSGSVSTNTWTHVAVCRASGTLRLFINGNIDGSATVTDSLNGAAGTRIGGGYADGSGNPGFYLTGYIDDLRITKGYARYTANFTPQRSQWQDQ
jgi:hypothetical protein